MEEFRIWFVGGMFPWRGSWRNMYATGNTTEEVFKTLIGNK